MPTCSTASGDRSASMRAVCAAASIGPMPQQNVSNRRTCASSRSVAATTSTLGGGCGRSPGLLEADLAVLGVHADRVAVGEVAFEQPQRERVLDETLDRALQRPGAVRRIPARLRERLLRGVRELELDPPLGEP